MRLKRKLAEIWEMDSGDYQLRVSVGEFQLGFTPDADEAENIATYEIIEVLRKIVTEADANQMQVISERPPEN